jgi:hypothetical protein
VANATNYWGMKPLVHCNTADLLMFKLGKCQDERVGNPQQLKQVAEPHIVGLPQPCYIVLNSSYRLARHCTHGRATRTNVKGVYGYMH